jgi:hypothetical protein
MNFASHRMEDTARKDSARARSARPAPIHHAGAVAHSVHGHSTALSDSCGVLAELGRLVVASAREELDGQRVYKACDAGAQEARVALAGLSAGAAERNAVSEGGTSSYIRSDVTELEVPGDRTLSALFAKLEEIDQLEFPRSLHQIKFHDCFTRASLRILYGNDYDRCEKRLLHEFDSREFRNEVMIVTPRRFGKTFSVAQYCAAFTASVLGKEVAIFSTGRRASKKILDLVVRFLEPILRPTQRIVTRNQEEVHVFDEETGKRNKVCSYPSKVQTLKGSGGDLIVCEEAAYMDSQVFYEVVVPLLGLRDTALIAISTILDPSNFYTKLIDMKDGSGKALFDVQKFELVCAKCKQTATPWECTHMTDTLPPWLSGEKHEKIRNFLPPELIGRETMGITMSDANKAFAPACIAMFVAAPLTVLRGVAKQVCDRVLHRPFIHTPHILAEEAPGCAIYTAVDPSGGGASDYAIASVLHHDGKFNVRAPRTRASAAPPRTAARGPAPSCRGRRSPSRPSAGRAGSCAGPGSRRRACTRRPCPRTAPRGCAAPAAAARRRRSARRRTAAGRGRTAGTAATAAPTAAACRAARSSSPAPRAPPRSRRRTSGAAAPSRCRACRCTAPCSSSRTHRCPRRSSPPPPGR